MPTRKTRKKSNRRAPRSRVVKKSVKMERHHRLPRSRGGGAGPDNIIILSQPVHRAWHYLFGNANAEEVAAMITDTFIDANYYMVAVPRHKKKAKSRRTRCMCTTCGAEIMKLLPKTCKGEKCGDN